MHHLLLQLQGDTKTLSAMFDAFQITAGKTYADNQTVCVLDRGEGMGWVGEQGKGVGEQVHDTGMPSSAVSWLRRRQLLIVAGWAVRNWQHTFAPLTADVRLHFVLLAHKCLFNRKCMIA